MGKGLPRWAIKKAQAAKAKNVFAYAWSLVKKKSGKAPKSINPKKRTSNPVRRMAKKKYHRRGGFTLPIAPVAGIVGGIAMAKHPWAAEGDTIINLAMRGDLQNAFKSIGPAFTGFDDRGNFHLDAVLKVYGPMVLGAVIHWVVGGKLGINRMLGRAKVPIIRI
jgi:hypothetical protein